MDVVILGGGFGGLYTALHLQRLLRQRRDVRATLVSRTNYFLMTPLLFEASSGVLEPRHAVNPIRPLLHGARFIEAEIESVDFERKVVNTRLALREPFEIRYDALVFALGGVTNLKLIPGSHHALTFKTLADAIHLRNHAIQVFEQADVEKDPARKRALLTFVIVGGGFVGVELQGELTIFLSNLTRFYRHIDPHDIQFHLIEAMPRIANEFDDDLADYASRVLKQRGVQIHVGTRVEEITPGGLRFSNSSVDSATIILATGVIPNPLLKDLPLEKDRRGRIIVEPTMQTKARPEIWALGDCASIPDVAGNPYPPLAQHALREAKQVAKNIVAHIDGKPLAPFIYTNKGNLAALGHFKGVGRIKQFKIRGFVAWWVWRSYYLMQMPQWSRRIRIMIDWTVALLFRNDVVQLDLERNTPREQTVEMSTSK